MYKSKLYHTQFYADATKNLLNLEISSKEKLISVHNNIVRDLKNHIFAVLSIVDIIIFKKLFNKNIYDFTSLTKERHERKLRSLGIFTPTFPKNEKMFLTFHNMFCLRRKN